MIMFFDLNIPVGDLLDRTSRDKLKLILYRLSQYDNKVVVALNYTLKNYSSTSTKLPELVEPPIEYDNIRILRRITVETDTSLNESIWTTLKTQYDLVAIQTSERTVFEQACHTYDIDIISLNCTERLAFTIDQMMVKRATARDVYFELQYGPGIRDDKSRGYVYQLGQALVSCQPSLPLIISSGAEMVSELRAPFDIYYFAKSFGLPNDLAKFPCWRNPESLLHLKGLL
ncbi:RNase P subunit p30-domain-containing protein [Chlamydoabsidia padenii]|nr:RNase P subunit p30-domain-containing protein [Chlamydoabsidia padenii]